MVDQNSKSTNWNDKELCTETIMIWVICRFKFNKDQIAGSKGGTNENDFHTCVIKRDERGEKIQVSSQEDDGEQDLTLSRDT